MASHIPSLVISEAPARWLEFLGEVVAVRLESDASAEGFTLLDVHTPARGGIPVLHTHPGAETMIVLRGEYEFYGREHGSRRVVAAPVGTVVYVPDGAPHGYANVGEAPGRLLVFNDAAAQMDAFFAAVGAPVEGPGATQSVLPDLAAWLQAMHTYRFTFVEPPDGSSGASAKNVEPLS